VDAWQDLARAAEKLQDLKTWRLGQSMARANGLQKSWIGKFSYTTNPVNENLVSTFF